MWAVLVFDGIQVEFAPELHSCRSSATNAAERWAWILSSKGDVPIRRCGEFEWAAGFRQVVMVSVEPTSRAPRDPWIGLAWDEGCYPVPSVVMLDGLQQAADWVGSAAGPTDLSISRWEVAARLTSRSSLRRAMASRAKVITDA